MSCILAKGMKSASLFEDRHGDGHGWEFPGRRGGPGEMQGVLGRRGCPGGGSGVLGRGGQFCYFE